MIPQYQAIQHPMVPAYCSLSAESIENRPKDTYTILYSPNTSSVKISMPITQSNTTSSIRKNSAEYNHLLTNCPWVKDFLQTAHHLNEVKSLLPYYSEINKLIATKKFNLCNIFLREVRPQELSDVLLVGLLRLTFSWKNDLPNWSILLERTKQELSNRKYDSNSLLRGLV
ncbi:MAG: hypothetical protein NTV00_03255 [Methylococcales bacterium]|nr:hypothetical protein [Methylococcales bacterium]